MEVLLLSDCKVAVTEVVVLVGINAGAVYKPPELIVPHASPVHPKIAHVTALEFVPLTAAGELLFFTRG